MRRRVLSMAVLLGLASLAASAEVRAMPTLSASITIGQSNVVQVTGKRVFGHQKFHRGMAMHRNKGFARHQHGFHGRPKFHRDKDFARQHHGFHGRPKFHRDKSFARHHQGYHRPGRGFHHPDVFVAKRIGRSHVVIVTPSHGWLSYRAYVAPRPLIKNGSFARRPYW